jgi:hypothetical protein
MAKPILNQANINIDKEIVANELKRFETDPSVDAVTTATRPFKDLRW